MTFPNAGGATASAADMTQPQIRPAGITAGNATNAKDCLTWDNNKPGTPAEIKKYRQSLVHEPGKIVTHYGTAQDPVPEGPFGAKTISKKGESVADYIKCYPDGEIARWKLEQSEVGYASTKKEPLGRGYARGHVIPAELGTTVPFGVSTSGQDDIRTVMFPDKGDYEDPNGTHQMYVKSHAAYKPGEQRNRNYKWEQTGVDPENFRFGAVDRDYLRDGVKKALGPGFDEGAPQPSKIVTKVQEDFKSTTADMLGKPKPLGLRGNEVSSEHVFGVPSMKFPEPGVREILLNSCPPELRDPEADLGKSLREGWRNVPTDRVLGVPTIRTDIPLPKARSVANTVNYGNEPDALQLLRPPKSAERGIAESHYVTMRAKAEVYDLVKDSGIDLSDKVFQEVFQMAANADGVSEDQCCLDTFFKARHFLLQRTLEIPPPF